MVNINGHQVLFCDEDITDNITVDGIKILENYKLRYIKNGKQAEQVYTGLRLHQAKDAVDELVAERGDTFYDYRKTLLLPIAELWFHDKAQVKIPQTLKDCFGNSKERKILLKMLKKDKGDKLSIMLGGLMWFYFIQLKPLNDENVLVIEDYDPGLFPEIPTPVGGRVETGEEFQKIMDEKGETTHETINRMGGISCKLVKETI